MSSSIDKPTAVLSELLNKQSIQNDFSVDSQDQAGWKIAPKNKKAQRNADRIASRPKIWQKLPLELRWIIYEHFLSTPHTIIISPEKEYNHDQGILVPFLLANKQTRDEVQALIKKTLVPVQNGFGPEIKFPFVGIFNPEATTFRLVPTDYRKPLDLTIDFLWEKMAVLYHCDSMNRLVLRRYEARNPEIERFWNPSRNMDFQFCDLSSNWEQVTKILYNEFNVEFGRNISFREKVVDIDSSRVEDQMIRIPYSYHRLLKDLDGEDFVKETCRLSKLRPYKHELQDDITRIEPDGEEFNEYEDEERRYYYSKYYWGIYQIHPTNWEHFVIKLFHISDSSFGGSEENETDDDYWQADESFGLNARRGHRGRGRQN